MTMTMGQVIGIKIAYTFFSLFSLLFGIFLATKPQLAIRFQIKFYEKINWRVEPISMAKEVHNTRVMGVFLVAVFLFTVFYALTQPLVP